MAGRVMGFIIKLSFLLVFIVSQAVHAAEPPRDPYKYFFHESFGDFTEELETAKEEGKKGILLFFEMDECPYCHYMKNKVLNQRKVQEYYRKNFKIFAVDVEGDIEIKIFNGETMKMKEFALKKHRVRATPVFAFYDLDGKKIHSKIGKTSSVDEFLLMGKYIAEGIYKDVKFTRYKEQLKEQNK